VFVCTCICQFWLSLITSADLCCSSAVAEKHCMEMLRLQLFSLKEAEYLCLASLTACIQTKDFSRAVPDLLYEIRICNFVQILQEKDCETLASTLRNFI